MPSGKKPYKGLQILVPAIPEIPGCWIKVNCSTEGCTAYAGHWSRNGKSQDRTYKCEKCSKLEELQKKYAAAMEKDKSTHTTRLSSNA